MFRCVEIIFALQFSEVRDVLELAISVRSVHRECPVAIDLGTRTRRQTNQQARDTLSRQSIANKELLRRPWLGHLRDGGNAGILLRSMWQRRVRIRSGRRYLDLRRRFSRRGLGVSRAENPSPAEKNHEQNGEKNADHPDRWVIQRIAVWALGGDSGNLRHFCLIAVRWGLVRHSNLPCS